MKRYNDFSHLSDEKLFVLALFAILGGIVWFLGTTLLFAVIVQVIGNQLFGMTWTYPAAYLGTLVGRLVWKGLKAFFGG